MKALITGGSGFIGSHLADQLIGQGWDVTVIDNLSTGRADNVKHLEKNPRFHLIIGNILNEFLMDKLVERCDVVFHLAAAVGVELIIRNPLQSLTTNIRGSEIVLEMVHRYNKKVLITSTSEIYGKNKGGPLKEDDDRILGSPLKSRWSYSTSKAVDEILGYVYWKEKSVPTVIVRLFNTVGPRQTGSYGMVIPRFVGQALRNEPITVFGNGRQTRCFLDVEDAVRAMAGLIQEPRAYGQVFNIGSQQEVSIGDLAARIIAHTQSKSSVVLVPYNEAYEEGFEDMERRVPDIGKIHRLLDFEPTKNLDQIIEGVVRYARQRIPATQEVAAVTSGN